MRDKDLSDDQLKLVRYKILFVKRDYEVAFPEREELVHDNMTGDAFAAWKVAEFIQELNRKGTYVPPNWRDGDGKLKYPKGSEHTEKSDRGWLLLGLPEGDTVTLPPDRSGREWHAPWRRGSVASAERASKTSRTATTPPRLRR